MTPTPVIRRPIGMAVRDDDPQWGRFLNQWLELKQFDGDMEQLHRYWIQGGGAAPKKPRWSVARDILGWAP